MTGHKLAPICRSLGISRATAYRQGTPRASRYARGCDRKVTGQIRAVIRTRVVRLPPRHSPREPRVSDGL